MLLLLLCDLRPITYIKMLSPIYMGIENYKSITLYNTNQTRGTEIYSKELFSIYLPTSE